jgi:hypothetical protein
VTHAVHDSGDVARFLQHVRAEVMTGAVERKILRQASADYGANYTSAILSMTFLPRFARHAVVTFSDQLQLRLSCPPFQLTQNPKSSM